MTNITKYPLEDGFLTNLAQSWDGNVWTMYLNNVPNFTFPSWVTTYLVVEPGTTRMQIAEINAIDTVAKTVTVSNITVEKWAWVNSTALSHWVNSKVIISDNYQFWLDIVTSINSKLDNDLDFNWDAATDFGGIVAKSLTTAQREALTAENGMVVYDTTIWELYQYIGGAWSAVSAGSTQPNASETVAGKVEQATQIESDAWASTWWTGAKLIMTPETSARSIQKNIHTKAESTTWDDAYVVTLTPAPTAYVEWMEILIKPDTTNTGACSVNVNSLWVVNIKATDWEDPQDSEIPTTQYTRLKYDWTNFVIQDTKRATNAQATAWTDRISYVTPEQLDWWIGYTLIPININWQKLSGSSSDSSLLTDWWPLLASANNTVTMSGVTENVYAKKKEIAIPANASWSITVYFEASNIDSGGSHTSYFRVYKNWVAVGTEYTNSSSSNNYTAVSENFSVSWWDLIQLYMTWDNVGSWQARNFRIIWGIQPNSLAITVNMN